MSQHSQAAQTMGSPGRALLPIGVALYFSCLVVLPLAALATKGLQGGLGALWDSFTTPVAAKALSLTLWTAGTMSLVNAIMGTATAWVLVRYRFPGRTLLSALVDLPFAMPTLVAGILLVILLGPQSALGGWLDARGIRIAFAQPAIVLALLFVTLPMVVRAVEPVLLELDQAEEEAAQTLGASTLVVFVRVLLPPLLPAICCGTLQSFARALAEFGSIVAVSGNIPHRTLTAPVYIFGLVESGRPELAAAVSTVLLGLALALLASIRSLQRMVGASHG